MIYIESQWLKHRNKGNTKKKKKMQILDGLIKKNSLETIPDATRAYRRWGSPATRYSFRTQIGRGTSPRFKSRESCPRHCVSGSRMSISSWWATMIPFLVREREREREGQIGRLSFKTNLKLERKKKKRTWSTKKKNKRCGLQRGERLFFMIIIKLANARMQPNTVGYTVAFSRNRKI
jgi:hypothetical protein